MCMLSLIHLIVFPFNNLQCYVFKIHLNEENFMGNLNDIAK